MSSWVLWKSWPIQFANFSMNLVIISRNLVLSSIFYLNNEHNSDTDNALLIHPHKTTLPDLVDKLNKVKQMIESIYEIERNNTLHFLDIMLHHNDNSPKLNVHRKSTKKKWSHKFLFSLQQQNKIWNNHLFLFKSTQMWDIS